ncbi:MAG: MotA/TolQ/ExbB proton channel family protein [Akkermansia sp.]|nr:MotA/TolQ/ExbB proton channel family protein [Akkermansia sp.]
MQKEFQVFRYVTCGLSVIVAIFIIVLCNLLPTGSMAASFLVNKIKGVDYIAPQNFMWIAFFWALAELFVRAHMLILQKHELQLHLLPERDDELLTSSRMPTIHSNVLRLNANGQLGCMVKLLASQFQISRSVSMCSAVLKSETELLENRIELGYNIVRYITWMIPTLGFIGTVQGILMALNVASKTPMNDPTLLSKVITDMSTAFWTTLLALILSCIIMWVMHLVQGREETYLNDCANYCLKNFINKIYVK